MRVQNIVMILVVLTVASLAAVSEAAQDNSAYEGILSDYLFIQTALAGDTTEGIAAKAASIEKASAKLSESFDSEVAGISSGKSGELKQILPQLKWAASNQGKAGNIDTARDAFGKLSESMIAYRQLVTGKKLEAAYCPMAKKSWIQEGKSITNPYYGSSMLRCGSIVSGK